jgi:hypothetical protein
LDSAHEEAGCQDHSQAQGQDARDHRGDVAFRGGLGQQLQHARDDVAPDDQADLDNHRTYLQYAYTSIRMAISTPTMITVFTLDRRGATGNGW